MKNTAIVSLLDLQPISQRPLSIVGPQGQSLGTTLPQGYAIRLSEVHKTTGAELVSNSIVGRNLGTKQKVTSQIRRVRHQSSFELRKGELQCS